MHAYLLAESPAPLSRRILWFGAIPARILSHDPGMGDTFQPFSMILLQALTETEGNDLEAVNVTVHELMQGDLEKLR